MAKSPIWGAKFANVHGYKQVVGAIIAPTTCL